MGYDECGWTAPALVREEPWCEACGDTGHRCEHCRPTPAQRFRERQAQARFERRVAAGEFDYEDIPF